MRGEKLSAASSAMSYPYYQDVSQRNSPKIGLRRGYAPILKPPTPILYREHYNHPTPIDQPVHFEVKNIVQPRPSKPLIKQLSSNQIMRCCTRIRIFAEESTVHGIWHIIRNDRHWLSRTAWFFAFAVCFTVCVYFIAMSFIRYLSYEVKTTTSVDVAREIEFPAVTICNENVGIRSLVGSNALLLQALTAFTINSAEQYVEKFKVTRAQCAHNDSVDPALAEALKEGYEFFKKNGMTKAFSMLAPDSINSVAQCWWKNEAKNCTGLFLNHMTDHGWCFTLNPHPILVKSYSLGTGPTDTGYGVDRNYTALKLISTGPSNSMRLLLNTHQDEYCVTKDDTAGFKILIHDPRVQPLFFLDRPIYLSPGFETYVGVRFRRQVKLTQELGRCTDFKHLSMYPNATVYFKEACYLECFARYVYEKCQCLPAYGPPRSNYVMAAELGQKYLNICFADQTMLCMKKYERTFLDLGLTAVRCKDCADPCNETEYDFQISMSYFPSRNSFVYYNRTLSNAGSLKEMRDNYIMVNFYVETMLINVITETQAFTVDQLVADMGGQLGFLLGMSVLSLFEFILFIMPDKGARKLRKPKHFGTFDNGIQMFEQKKY